MSNHAFDLYEVSRRYLKAYISSCPEGSVAVNLRKVIEFITVLVESKDFMTFIQRPMPVSKKEEAIRALCEKGALDKISTSFILLLLRNRSVAILLPVLQAFKSYEMSLAGSKSVDVYATHNISSESVQKIKDYFNDEYSINAIVNIHVDPSLVSGYVFYFDDRCIDFSMKLKLKHLHSAIKGI